MSDGAPLVRIDNTKWLHTFRDITNATNKRTFVAGSIPWSGVGNSAPVFEYENGQAIASALLLANLNSLPLDWAARFSVGGVHMNFFILKQLPVLPPEAYLEVATRGSMTYGELVVHRVLELTFTTNELKGFARDLGYRGPTFPWDENRRHCLKCELDAIFLRMYKLNRSEVEWILDAPAPSSSFPGLKRNELRKYGEFRTKRYVLQGYEQLERDENPKLEGSSA